MIRWGGLTVPPLPVTEEAFCHAILERRDMMTEADRNRPENAADNDDASWLRLTREREDAVAAYDRPRRTPPAATVGGDKPATRCPVTSRPPATKP